MSICAIFLHSQVSYSEVISECLENDDTDFFYYVFNGSNRDTELPQKYVKTV